MKYEKYLITLNSKSPGHLVDIKFAPFSKEVVFLASNTAVIKPLHQGGAATFRAYLHKTKYGAHFGSNGTT
jgi:hypothetical protein